VGHGFVMQQAGDPVAAVDLLAQHGCWPRLLQVAARLHAHDSDKGRSALQRATAAFRQADRTDIARELLHRLGDYRVGSCMPSCPADCYSHFLVQLDS
jgi:hypothetical protein